MSDTTKSVILHTSEVAVATSLPFIINALSHASWHADVLVPIAVVLSAVAKTLRELGVLPDYVNG